ncbi:hypothetical protein [Solimicrobium silvestre]|uniref:Uncharacterized protein n=1 Tax=Solimicrobium silvestre TaxID=2099400 RepID=A0A2S9GY90_9BURK|nr:hypothetical protein [Solimicrobium silvestre]PRC92626.1 hypothetical protein S2091_2681 [Solimicrobium silvestre]
MNTVRPTKDEQQQFRISSFKGIDVGLGQADPVASISAKLEAQYPNHLILVQAGKFLHGYDKSAHALSVLKQYKVQLVGTTDAPHIRVGFPSSNFKKRLWSIVNDFQIPYVVALGTKASGHDIFVSDNFQGKSSVLSAISNDVVSQVIYDLQQRGEINKVTTKQILSNPDSSGFKLKSQAQDLDLHLTQDIIKMPRDIRVTFGENIRVCMARIMRGIFAYGLEVQKSALLNKISADIDLLKHYLAQAARLNNLKFAFEHRVGLAVELGRLLGGVIRAAKVPS